MKTEILRPASTEDFARAAALIRDGQLVAFPTETVYGLGANGLDATACARIYEAKGRPSDNPLILHIADLSMLHEAAEDVPPAAAHLLTAFAPGPITVIVPKAAHIPPLVTGGLSTVGVRCPAHDVARRLIHAAGVPIAAPSANISGRPSPTTATWAPSSWSLRDPPGPVTALDGSPGTSVRLVTVRAHAPGSSLLLTGLPAGEDCFNGSGRSGPGVPTHPKMSWRRYSA